MEGNEGSKGEPDAGHGRAPLLTARNTTTPCLAPGFRGGGGPQVGGLGSRQRRQMGAEGNQMAAEEEAPGFRGVSCGVVFFRDRKIVV